MQLLRRLGSSFIGESITAALLIALLVAALLPVAALALLPIPESSRFAASSTVALVGAFSVAAVTARRFRSPLVATVSTLNDVADGDLNISLRGGPIREFSELSDSVHYMAERLRDTTTKLVHKAFHDPLTGLPNRALFMNHLQDALQAHSGADDQVAVIFIDLDRFKVLNDTLGHAAGDDLLVAVTRRLSGISNPGGTFARLAGDEFVFLVVSPSAESRSCAVAEAINERLADPFTIEDREVYVAVSIGIAAARAGEPRPLELLRWADIAVYRAKAHQRALYICYDPALDVMPLDRIDLESALRRAIERNQLRLHYQPEFDLASGAIIGMEALLRWDHPVRGVLSPAEFIALAEETGEIHNIGQWVLGEACRKAAALNRDFMARGESAVMMGVNLSPREFYRDGLVEDVARTLRETGLLPQLLRLEITESILLDDVGTTIRVLHDLKALGVQLAIDDFGTGYSSLSYLQRLPVDTLKIDQSFVRTLGRDKRSLPIVAAVVQLAKALDIGVTAEGIETAEQLRLLGRAGCAFGQGFYLSMGVDEEELDAVIDHVRLTQSVVA
ncbi:MAG: putative bifunctional diguanylate cyclase/phosphodiesterase [Tepidiformaceae bacterium]